jgi:predicted ribosome quality control (RQC) complex YloA/Tae2 family protein
MSIGMRRKGRRKTMSDNPTSLRIRYNELLDEVFVAIAKLEKTRFDWSKNELNDRIKELQKQARKLDQQINDLTTQAADALNDVLVLKA